MLTVDTREPEFFKKKFTVAQLQVGDFVDTDLGLGIERKNVFDLVHSVYSNKLERQLFELCSTFEYSFLIIEGRIQDLFFNHHTTHWTVKHHMGFLASYSLKFPNLCILSTDNKSQTLTLLNAIAEKCVEPSAIGLETDFKEVKYRADPLLLQILVIPNIGLKRAKTLLEHFKHPFKLYNASIEEISKLDGFGEKTAESVKKVFEVVE